MKAFLLAGVCLAALAGPARAQWTCLNCTQEMTEVVREAARAAQVVKELAQLKAQYDQLVYTYQAIAHAPTSVINSIGGLMDVPMLRSPLPPVAEMSSLVGGAGAIGQLGGQVSRFAGANRIYTAPGQDYGAYALNRNASSIAGVQASASQLYQSAQAHSDALRSLENELKNAPDAKTTADLQARIAMEQAQLQTHQLQAQALNGMQGAQTRLTEQQREEARRCYIDAELQGTDMTQDTCARPASQGAVQLASAGMGVGGLASGYEQYIGQSVGSGQCVALLQNVDPNIGNTRTWTQGAQVLGNTDLAPGTMIATFDGTGRYSNNVDGSSHAAIYLGQDASGIHVLDQWVGHAASERVIGMSGSAQANSAGAFYVIGHSVDASN